MTDNPEDKIVQLMREIEEMRLLLSGRTVSCNFCNEMEKQVRDACDHRNELWRAAYTYLRAHTGTYEEQRKARLALSKLVGEE